MKNIGKLAALMFVAVLAAAGTALAHEGEGEELPAGKESRHKVVVVVVREGKVFVNGRQVADRSESGVVTITVTPDRVFVNGKECTTTPAQPEKTRKAQRRRDRQREEPQQQHRRLPEELRKKAQEALRKARELLTEMEKRKEGLEKRLLEQALKGREEAQERLDKARELIEEELKIIEREASAVGKMLEELLEKIRKEPPPARKDAQQQKQKFQRDIERIFDAFLDDAKWHSLKRELGSRLDKLLERLFKLPEEEFERVVDRWIEKNIDKNGPGRISLEKVLRRIMEGRKHQKPRKDKEPRQEPDKKEKPAPRRREGEF